MVKKNNPGVTILSGLVILFFLYLLIQGLFDLFRKSKSNKLNKKNNL